MAISNYYLEMRSFVETGGRINAKSPKRWTPQKKCLQQWNPAVEAFDMTLHQLYIYIYMYKFILNIIDHIRKTATFLVRKARCLRWLFHHPIDWIAREEGISYDGSTGSTLRRMSCSKSKLQLQDLWIILVLRKMRGKVDMIGLDDIWMTMMMMMMMMMMLSVPTINMENQHSFDIRDDSCSWSMIRIHDIWSLGSSVALRTTGGTVTPKNELHLLQVRKNRDLFYPAEV